MRSTQPQVPAPTPADPFTTMSFDEQLRNALDTLTGRVRDEVAKELRAITDELVATARDERDRAVEDAAAQARAVSDAAAEAARANLRRADLTASQRLLDAVRTMDGARSLTDVLDALVTSAGREAARAGLLLVRGSLTRGWRFAGFDHARVPATDAEVPLPADVSTLFELADGRQRMALPIAIGGQTIAILYADEGPANDPDRELAPGWPAAVEVMARHAARSLEALTAFKAARAMTERSVLAPISSLEGADRPGEAEEAAQRYARLLVSEIKLYHEADVVAGRRERDLASRLGGEIQRARALYDERVPAPVRLRTDFFQAELVRTLADGDPTLLEAKG
jgi:hypothetical protein